MKRNLLYSKEFVEFKETLSERAKLKLDFSISILQNEFPISNKFVKKLISSDFYELRIKVDNEIRVILFAIDNQNLNLATKILVLNGFIKKSNKDYERNIQKAYTILNDIIDLIK